MPTLDQAKKWNWPLIMRLLSIFCGVGTIFTGIFSLLGSLSDFPAAFIINAYLILFAGLIIVAELRFRALLSSFQFLQTYLGRGIFCIFVATICFIYPSSGNIAMGVILLVNGLIQTWFVVSKHPAYIKEQAELAEKGYVNSEVGIEANRILRESSKQIIMSNIVKSDAPARNDNSV